MLAGTKAFFARPLHAFAVCTILLLLPVSAYAQAKLQCPPPDTEPAGAAVQPPGNFKVSVNVDPTTVWQPPAGQVRFTMEGSQLSLDGLNVIVCFRWHERSAKPKVAREWVQSPLVRPIKVEANKIVFAATVPGMIPNYEPWSLNRLLHRSWVAYEDPFNTVPTADFRVMASTSAAWSRSDITLPVGITSVAWSLFLTVVIVLIAWRTLYRFGRQRGVPGQGPILTIISTKGGVASLSQFQIILWTFVVGAGAVYVIALSGNLINISQGTLILLGITGLVTVGSKMNQAAGGGAQQAPPPAPTAPAPVANIKTDPHDTAVTLSWAAATTGGPPSGYTVKYRPVTNPESVWRVATLNIATPAFTLTGLTPATDYEFQVIAANAGGLATTSITQRTSDPVNPPANAPGRVPNLSATAAPGESGVVLRWGQPGGNPSRYNVEYRVRNSDQFWTSASNTVAETNFTVKALVPNTNYDFRVTASNAAGDGPPSTTINSDTGARIPVWSDLVVVDGPRREIDVTRLQMLFFTTITAFFVGMKVLTGYEIPEIPENFLLLMGISNGVYLTSKYVG